MSDIDFREVDDDGKDLREDTLSDTNDDNEPKDDDYEQICHMCKRSESITGRMIKIPGGISICVDCLQKTFDTVADPNQMGGLGVNPFSLTGPMGMATTLPPTIEDSSSGDKDKESTSDSSANPAGANPFYYAGLPSIFNMGEIMPIGNKSQRVKKQQKKKKHTAVFDINNIPAPHVIKEKMDEYVVGQEHAKKVMSVAVYNHYKRISNPSKDDGIEIEKSNMLMIGPTGSGKTYMVKTLARLLDVPLAITDATSLTEAGYIGDDIESVVSKLLAAADNDIEKAQKGIIFIDEIDKLAKKKNANQRDVSGESVQQGMLKLLEGAEIEVPVGSNSKNSMVPLANIDTRDILFICGGAFPDLDVIVKERLNKASSMGFNADLKDKYDDDKDILLKTTVEDLRTFGMIPEFIGRLPILFSTQKLDEDMLIKILMEPKNAIIKQYQRLLELDEVKLTFDEDALRLIASKAMEKELGARALRAIIEEFMLDIMYEIPKDDNIGEVVITKSFIEGGGAPKVIMRGNIE